MADTPLRKKMIARGDKKVEKPADDKKKNKSTEVKENADK